MRASPSSCLTASVAGALAVAALTVLMLPGPASAQERTSEARQSQLDLATGLFVAGAILAPLGNAAVAVGTVGLAVDADPMIPGYVRDGWAITLVIGLAVWIAGGATLIAATEVYQRARRWLLLNPSTPREGGIRPPPGAFPGEP